MGLIKVTKEVFAEAIFQLNVIEVTFSNTAEFESGFLNIGGHAVVNVYFGNQRSSVSTAVIVWFVAGSPSEYFAFGDLAQSDFDVEDLDDDNILKAILNANDGVVINTIKLEAIKVIEDCTDNIAVRKKRSIKFI